MPFFTALSAISLGTQFLDPFDRRTVHLHLVNPPSILKQLRSIDSPSSVESKRTFASLRFSLRFYFDPLLSSFQFSVFYGDKVRAIRKEKRRANL